MFEVTETELQTRKLFSEYMGTLDSSNHAVFSSAIMVSKVFIGHYTSAMPAARVNALAALHHHFNDVDLQNALTRMVKAMVLRTRFKGGERLYEINY